MPCLPDIDPTLGNARLGMTEETREDAIMMKIIQSLFYCHESGMCSRMRCRFGQCFAFFFKPKFGLTQMQRCKTLHESVVLLAEYMKKKMNIQT